jgi:adenylosuccinate synthase
MEDHLTRAKAFGIEDTIDIGAVASQYADAAEKLRPLICDTAWLLGDAMAAGKNLLFEGAQGTMLDKIRSVIGVSKAYITRVGGGPFPTEALDDRGDLIRNRGHEFGSVTGRPRRCGWFDAPLLRYSALLNGFETMVVTKLDVLDELDEIPVCVAYKINGATKREMPATVRELALAEPVYEVLPGWKSSTEGISDWDQLPAAARDYVTFLEKQTGVEAGCISTGPERNQTVRRKNSRFAAATS